MRRLRPDLVVATGGHASLAGGLAAALTRTPLVVQEQNRIPGLASRLLGRLARRVYVGFPGTEKAFSHPQRVRFLGNPVREDLLRPRDIPPEVPRDRPVLVVLGGSRGARSVNRAVAAAIPLLRETRCFWIWQTGDLDFPALQPTWGHDADVLLQKYLGDVGAAYAVATLLVCRAGAMTLSEITALGKAAILVPFPGAVDDHQTANARTLSDAGAAFLLPDRELSGERLAQEVAALLQAPERLQDMAARSRNLGRPEATSALVQDFMQVLGGPTGRQEHVRSG
jgi:UDP-N-acetylglucosamine--N-acetylmuramyl-(pentapeptide) pyrophosphoryl-undecaprenol N-acetylglucosamine transferase